MADIIKYTNIKDEYHCSICGINIGVIPHWKFPNGMCSSCLRVVKTQRRKVGLTEIPKINKNVVEKRTIGKKRFLDWYKEELVSDDKFGKKVRIKLKDKIRSETE